MLCNIVRIDFVGLFYDRTYAVIIFPGNLKNIVLGLSQFKGRVSVKLKREFLRLQIVIHLI